MVISTQWYSPGTVRADVTMDRRIASSCQSVQLTMEQVALDHSLSIILPVRNAAVGLNHQLEMLMDTVCELTPDFEIIVVDDGSTDGTDDVASELERNYPQLHFVQHPSPQGIEAAIRTGMLYCRGDVVFVQEGDETIRSDDLRKLWRLRDDEQLVMARASAPAARPLSPDLLGRLQNWGMMLKESAGNDDRGLRMIRREGVDQLSRAGDASG